MKRHSLLPHNTFGIDVSATNFLEYSSVNELKRLIADSEITVPYLHIGQGSNLLFTKDFDGTILHSSITGLEVKEEDEKTVVVRVGAGMPWDDFVAYCVSKEWYGAENLSLIPGEIGASAVQNIGAYGVEVKDLIDSVETVNIKGEEKIYPVEMCEYAYRSSVFKRPDMKSVFITYVNFSLSKVPCYKLEYGTIREELAKYQTVDLQTLRRVIIDIRRTKLPDPKILGNAGSFFMNPIIPRIQFDKLRLEYPTMPCYEIDERHVKIPAGWLIEQCGWKGKSMGKVGVHSKQALVLVNLGGAQGKDVVALAETIRASVYDKFQIKIYPEVNFV